MESVWEAVPGFHEDRGRKSGGDRRSVELSCEKRSGGRAGSIPAETGTGRSGRRD